MRSVRLRSELLSAPGFLLSLSMLWLNDTYLKAHFGNWATGKLSDVAGLFAFPMFCCAFAPRERQRTIYWMIALLFVCWKLPLADDAIGYWNAQRIYPIGRVVGYSDLLALLVMPVSHTYASAETPAQSGWMRRLRTPATVIASLLFVATSRNWEGVPDGAQYSVPASRSQTITSLQQLGARLTHAARGAGDPDTLYYNKFKEGDVALAVSTESGQTVVTIVQVISDRVTAKRGSLRALTVRNLLDPLHATLRAPADSSNQEGVKPRA